MTDTAVIDDPAAPIDFDTAINEEVKRQGGAPPMPVTKKEPPKEAPKPPEKPVEQKPPTPEVKAAPNAAPEKKDPLQKLSELRTPDAPLKTEGEEKAQSRWMELKTAEKERDDLKGRIPQLEGKIRELEAKAWKDEEKSELDELRVFRKAKAIELTPEWQNQVEIPRKQRKDFINRFSEHYQINRDSLWEAFDLTDPFQRSERIDEVLKGAQKEVPAQMAATVAQIAGDLPVIRAADEQMRKEALERGTALESEKAQASEKEISKSREEYQKDHGYVHSELSKKLPTLFSDPALAEAVKNAIPADDSRTMAYQAQAGELLPRIVEKLMETEKELATYKQERADRAAASPTMQKTDVALPKDKQAASSLEEAIELQKKYDPRTMG